MGKQEKFHIVSRTDGLKISVLYMQPDKTCCKGIVQILHGMSEYKERYLPFMEFLAENGYASVIHDHRGHGESVKSSDDYGYMYEVGIDGFLKDVLLVNEWARKKMPEVPFVLFGHSMGSLAARSFLKENDQVVDGAVICGAPCKNPAVGVALGLATVQKKIFGSRHIAELINVLCFSGYASKFAKEGSKFAWLNSDPAEVAKYDEDPACGFTFSVDGFQTLFGLLQMTFQKDGWKCERASAPILFIAGEDDPCIGNKDKYKEEVDFMRRVGYQNVDSILYEGMRHEILNEPRRMEVYQDVLAYLEENFGGVKNE